VTNERLFDDIDLNASNSEIWFDECISSLMKSLFEFDFFLFFFFSIFLRKYSSSQNASNFPNLRVWCVCAPLKGNFNFEEKNSKYRFRLLPSFESLLHLRWYASVLHPNHVLHIQKEFEKLLCRHGSTRQQASKLKSKRISSLIE